MSQSGLRARRPLFLCRRLDLIFAAALPASICCFLDSGREPGGAAGVDVLGGCMARTGPRLIRLLLGIAILVASIGSQPVAASTGSSGSTREISASGTAAFTAAQPAGTAGVEAYETPASGGDGAQVFDRSHSGSGDSTPVGAISQPKPVTNSAPGLITSFEGINHFQQRFGTPNQFSLEPPDQGLCIGSDGAGNTRALHVVNDPLGGWTVFRIAVQDDGTAGTPNHHCSPSPKPVSQQATPLPTNPTACFGDYPHIGSNAAGIFLTTNEYSFFGPEFHGAQVYALS